MRWKQFSEKRLQRWRARKEREADARGILTEDFTEQLIQYLIDADQVIEYTRTRHWGRLDRIGIDFIITLAPHHFANGGPRNCWVNAKSSIWCKHAYNMARDRILNFIPIVTQPVAKEASRLLVTCLKHVEKVKNLERS